MNPVDVAQSALPLTSSNLSLFALFWQAHWLVKAVMLGLLASSVWVWAIVIDKFMLYTRTRKAMDQIQGAVIGMTLVPAMLVLAVGSELIRTSVGRWFNQPMDQILASANDIAGDYYQERHLRVADLPHDLAEIGL